MGETGPCGPCSEVFYDYGPEMGRDGGPKDGSEERFVEIWNLVFMQFDQAADGTRTPLPKPSIDTGAGLERVAAVLQGVYSVWDTDLLRGLIETASSVTGKASRPRRAHRREPADPGRARPVVGHARERRRVPLERGPRLRAAPHHPPGGAPRLPARHRAARAPQAGGRGHRRDDAGLPRAGRQPRLHRGRRHARGGALPPDAAQRPGHPRPRAGRARPGRGPARGPRPSSCTTPTASRSSSPPRSPPSAASTSTGPASRPRWPSSGAGPRTPARPGRATATSSTPTGRSSRSSASPSSPATTTTRPRAACWRCSRSTTASSRCSPTARPSTPRPAARWATPA